MPKPISEDQQQPTDRIIFVRKLRPGEFVRIVTLLDGTSQVSVERIDDDDGKRDTDSDIRLPA